MHQLKRILFLLILNGNLQQILTLMNSFDHLVTLLVEKLLHFRTLLDHFKKEDSFIDFELHVHKNERFLHLLQSNSEIFRQLLEHEYNLLYIFLLLIFFEQSVLIRNSQFALQFNSFQCQLKVDYTWIGMMKGYFFQDVYLINT